MTNEIDKHSRRLNAILQAIALTFELMLENEAVQKGIEEIGDKDTDLGTAVVVSLLKNIKAGLKMLDNKEFEEEIKTV